MVNHQVEREMSYSKGSVRVEPMVVGEMVDVNAYEVESAERTPAQAMAMDDDSAIVALRSRSINFQTYRTNKVQK